MKPALVVLICIVAVLLVSTTSEGGEMATAEDVLNLARSQIGVCENPMGSNRGTPYHAWYGQQGIQWCAVFVSWLYNTVDPALIHGLRSAYSGDFLTVGRRYGEEVVDGEPGDIVVFDYGDGGITDHIGVVEARLGPTTWRTIEGNVGNCVGRKNRTRSSTCVMWFIRPKYPQPQQEEEEEMSMMFVPPQKMPKQGDLFVWDFAEGFNQLEPFSEVHCWLNLYNEGKDTADALVYTAPSSGETLVRLHGWQRKSVNIGATVKARGGFTTVVKSKSPNIVSGISVFGR